MNNNSKIRKGNGVQISKSLQRHERSERDRVITSLINSSSKKQELILSREEE
jgi:hypothetical protein